MNRSSKQAAVAHTEEEKFWGCIFRLESLVKSRLPRRAEGALLALKMMIPCVSKRVIFQGQRGRSQTHPPHMGGVYIHLCRYVLLYVCYVSYECYVEDARNGI